MVGAQHAAPLHQRWPVTYGERHPLGNPSPRLVAAILVVFGLTAVYGASSLLTISGGQVGSSFALKQALGAAVGGIVAALLARSDYHKWRRWAWPVLAVVGVLLLLPLLPFTERIAPNINGARRWVNLGFVTVQP